MHKSDLWKNVKSDKSDKELLEEFDNNFKLDAVFSDAEKQHVNSFVEVASPIISPKFGLGVSKRKSWTGTEGKEIHKDDKQNESILTKYLMNSRNTRNFLLNSIPYGATKMYCTFRMKNGVYQLFREGKDRDQFLLAGKKSSTLANITGSSIVLSCSADFISLKHESCVGKLTGNFVGSEYNLNASNYGTKKAKQRKLVKVEYQSTIMQGVPREITVHVPFDELADGKGCELSPRKHKKMDEQWMLFKSKRPNWSEEIDSYCLDFGGRVVEADVANFLLVENENDVPVMSFGRVDEENFSCDFEYPISPVAAFAIAITAVNPKLICE